MNLETKITIYKFTPQVFTLTQKNRHCFGDLFGDMACFFLSVFSFG